MKTIAMVVLAAALAIPVFAGPRSYQYGKVLSYDLGGDLAKRSGKSEVVYQVQVGSTIYKITTHSKRPEFSAGQDIECRIEKGRMFIEKDKGGEVKCDIVGATAQTQTQR